MTGKLYIKDEYTYIDNIYRCDGRDCNHIFSEYEVIYAIENNGCYCECCWLSDHRFILQKH